MMPNALNENTEVSVVIVIEPPVAALPPGPIHARRLKAVLDRHLWLDLGTISGFTTRFQLYTVPGQVYYQATRKLVLQGADGVVFVADSQARQLQENIESFQDLHENLAEQSVDPRSVPLVIQYNKQDLPRDLILTPEELSDAINFRAVPDFPADALHGPGVFETLRSISERVLKRLSAGSSR